MSKKAVLFCGGNHHPIFADEPKRSFEVFHVGRHEALDIIHGSVRGVNRGEDRFVVDEFADSDIATLLVDDNRDGHELVIVALQHGIRKIGIRLQGKDSPLERVLKWGGAQFLIVNYHDSEWTHVSTQLLPVV